MIAITMLLAVAGWSRVLQGMWAAPGAFFSLVWVVAVVPAVVVLSNYVTPEAVPLAVSFVAAVSLGSQVTLREGTVARQPAAAILGTPARRSEQLKLKILPALTTFFGLVRGCLTDR